MFVDVGYNNYVAVDKIITAGKPESSPIKRICREAKDKGKYIDLTQGKKTRSVIMAEGNEKELVVIGTSIQTTTIISRIKKIEEDRYRFQIEKNQEFILAEGSSE
jgi:regulator of extracellular matrix RemA (YlzA/DUF370 family)